MRIFITTLIFFLSVSIALSNAARSDEPSLLFPVECTLGQDCWTVNYTDTAAGPEARDYMCGHKTYDKHEGTDFAVRSLADVARGVTVRASADGTVLRLRDGEPDGPKTKDMLESIQQSGKECGNGIIIRHSDTLQTFYCHLKQGSITVEQGQSVKAGDTLAQIGQSGLAEFPHLHFSVIQDNHHVDPFTGREKESGCGLTTLKPLWRDTLDYEPFAIFDMGFSAEEPDFTALQKGKNRPDGFLINPKALVVWAAFYGLEEGDLIHISIKDPGGAIVAERSITQDRNRARQYYYTGRALDGAWPEGTFTAKITVKRDGYSERKREISIGLQR